MTLYELTDDYIRLMEMAEDPDIDEQAFRDTMAGIEGALEDKTDGYIKVIRTLKADADACKKESERLAKTSSAKAKSAERLEKALQWMMETTGKKKIKTALFSTWIQKNPAGVVMDESLIENIPKRFLKYKDPEVNRAEIKKAINAGDEEAMAIAHLESTESLRIR